MAFAQMNVHAVPPGPPALSAELSNTTLCIPATGRPRADLQQPLTAPQRRPPSLPRTQQAGQSERHNGRGLAALLGAGERRGGRAVTRAGVWQGLLLARHCALKVTRPRRRPAGAASLRCSLQAKQKWHLGGERDFQATPNTR